MNEDDSLQDEIDKLVCPIIRPVSPGNAMMNFHLYEPWIDQALQHDWAEATDIHDARTNIWSGLWQVLEIVDADKFMGVCCTEIVRRQRRDDVLNVVCLGGYGMKYWLHDLVVQLDLMAKGLKCVGITCTGRKGWARALFNEDFVPVQQLMMREVQLCQAGSENHNSGQAQQPR